MKDGSISGFVLDASMTLAWHYLDEISAAHDAVLARTISEGVVVPRHWPTEVANALVVGERGGRASVAASAQLIARLEAMTIEIDDRAFEQAMAAAMTLARAHRLTVYDAAYLDLARSRHLPLATLDRALAKAARALDVDVLGVAP